ncbi:EamA family transporter [Arthrobacter sp. HLT1-21]
MLSNRMILGMTAFAPAIWGTTYLVTAEYLPPDRPHLAAVLRALPAGLVLLLLIRRLPQGSWWWKAAALGVLNIGAFFALLFIAYRLPGGVAATMGAIQPLVVAVLASVVVSERLTARKIVAGMAGILGVALMVLSAEAKLDPIGVAAALLGTASMGTGVVLLKRWGQPASPLTLTAWQLVAGGLFLMPLAWLVEGPPPAVLTPANIAGYLYLMSIGTVVAYFLWFRGLSRLPASTASFFGSLSPLTATLCGWVFLSQTLSVGQLAGAVIIIATLITVARSTGSRDPVGRGDPTATGLRRLPTPKVQM